MPSGLSVNRGIRIFGEFMQNHPKPSASLHMCVRAQYGRQQIVMLFPKETCIRFINTFRPISNAVLPGMAAIAKLYLAQTAPYNTEIAAVLRPGFPLHWEKLFVLTTYLYVQHTLTDISYINNLTSQIFKSQKFQQIRV